MLTELRIKNFAIIEEMSIEFAPGLNVISGETGSGKSLVLDAFQLILGSRPKNSFFRKDTEGWEIEALLSLEDLPAELRAELPEQVRECDEILLSRSMSVSGRGRVFMNGSLGTVQLLQQISSRLLALCTQGAQTALHDPAYVQQQFDLYAGAEKRVREYVKHFSDLQRLERELSSLLQEKEKFALRHAELDFVIEELSELKPTEGMRHRLEERINEIRKLQEGAAMAQSALQILLEDEGVLALTARLRRESRSLPAAVRSEVEQQLDAAEGAFAEIERSLLALERPDEEGEAELAECLDLLAELARLERKYKTDSAGLCLILERAQEEQGRALDEAREEALRQAIRERRERVEESASEIRKLRYQGAKDFERKVGEELSSLGMKGVRVSLEWIEHEPRVNGTESASLMFAPNIGEERKPLTEIASGGELSRVLLVLKKLFRDKSGVNILVFDEVDTGISGAVAQAVGEKMSEISIFSQVVCITHLPQVACYADRLFSVSKSSNKRTSSIIRCLQGESQVEELAKMLSGYKVTDAARESARELLSSKEERLKSNKVDRLLMVS